MSKVKIQGNAGGTGIFTVAAPATNTDRTITLPDVDATVMTTAGGTIAGQLEVQTASGSQLKIHKTGVTTLGQASIADFQLTQTNSQSALLGRISTEFVSGWGGDLILHTKLANGSPDNTVTARMRIDNAGRVTMPYQPAFFSWGSSVTVSGTDFAFTQVEYNIGSHYNTSNGRFTAPITGLYTFSANALWINDSSTRQINLHKNGASVAEGKDGSVGSVINIGFTRDVYLVAGDFIQLINASGGAFISSPSLTWMSGRLIG